MRASLVLMAVAFLQLSCASQRMPGGPARAVIRVGDPWDEAISLLKSAGAERDAGLTVLLASQAEWMNCSLGVPKLPLREVWRVDSLIVKLWGDSPAWPRGKQERVTKIEIGNLTKGNATTLSGLQGPLREVDSVSVAVDASDTLQHDAILAANEAESSTAGPAAAVKKVRWVAEGKSRESARDRFHAWAGQKIGKTQVGIRPLSVFAVRTFADVSGHFAKSALAEKDAFLHGVLDLYAAIPMTARPLTFRPQ